MQKWVGSLSQFTILAPQTASIDSVCQVNSNSLGPTLYSRALKSLKSNCVSTIFVPRGGFFGRSVLPY